MIGCDISSVTTLVTLATPARFATPVTIATLSAPVTLATRFTPVTFGTPVATLSAYVRFSTPAFYTCCTCYTFLEVVLQCNQKLIRNQSVKPALE